MTEQQKGDPWIIQQLEYARARNREGTNPNRKRGRMVFDFTVGKVCIEKQEEAA